MGPKRDKTTPGATKQYSADAELGRSFAIGCGVLVLVFLCGWAVIALFWLQ
jgi:hypothetical protein